MIVSELSEWCLLRAYANTLLLEELMQSFDRTSYSLLHEMSECDNVRGMTNKRDH